MKKYLTFGIIFILLQIIAIYQCSKDGIQLENIGQIIGFFILGIAGIASLVKYFKTK